MPYTRLADRRAVVAVSNVSLSQILLCELLSNETLFGPHDMSAAKETGRNTSDVKEPEVKGSEVKGSEVDDMRAFSV